MKKIIASFLAMTLMIVTLCSNITTAKAFSNNSSNTEILLLENGYYIETIISDVPALSLGNSLFSTTKTITKSKTAHYKNAENVILWSISITATFTYNGSTSKCTACSHSSTCPAKSWKIKSISSSKSGNSATTKATATQSLGSTSNDFTESVTISCSKNGTVS